MSVVEATPPVLFRYGLRGRLMEPHSGKVI